MDLSEKLRRLRANEGLRRGQWRPLTQREVATALQAEHGVTLSQAYLSQLEQGRRGLSDDARTTLARFYGVHPGYLVSDPVEAVSAPPVASVGASAEVSTGAAHEARIPQLRHVQQAGYAINHAPNGVFGQIEHTQPPAPDPAAHLLVALRDSADPQRVLLMMERLLRLSETQLLALERAVAQAEKIESKRSPRRNGASLANVFQRGNAGESASERSGAPDTPDTHTTAATAATDATDDSSTARTGEPRATGEERKIQWAE